MNKIIILCLATVALATLSACSSTPETARTTTKEETTYRNPVTTTTTETIKK